MPGMMDMHVHLMILGHGDYDHWDAAYRSSATGSCPRSGSSWPASTARPWRAARRDIRGGEAPHPRGGSGPRMFVSGPFLQKSNTELQEFPHWIVERPRRRAAESADDRQRSGADIIKLIDQDQMTLDAEVKAIVGEAHKHGKHVAAHAHRADEIRMGLKAGGVDCFEHTTTSPRDEAGYDDDVLQVRDRNATLFWCPTIEGLFLSAETLQNPGTSATSASSRSAAEALRGRPSLDPRSAAPRLLPPRLAPR